MFTINLHDIDSSFPEDLVFNGLSSMGLEMSIGSWLSKNNPEKESSIMEALKPKLAEIQSQEGENAMELQHAFADEQMAKADRMAKELSSDSALMENKEEWTRQQEEINEKLTRRAL